MSFTSKSVCDVTFYLIEITFTEQNISYHIKAHERIHSDIEESRQTHLQHVKGN